MATASPDPVTQAAAYQQHLLGLLGQDDPAEVQASTRARLLAVVKDAGSDLRQTPAPGEWSVLELLGHLVDAEIVVSGRYRWILSHDRPPLMGYDQDRWVDELHRPPGSPEELLALFEPLRAANVALWYRTPDDRKDRVGIHAERGPESYELTFRLIAGHDRFHLAQAERALGAVRGT